MTIAAGIEPFNISRSFAAPRALVWKCFTEAGHLGRWWGPKGIEVLDPKIDLRPGGLFHYRMRGADGSETWGRFVFREIRAPERLVFVNSFSDASAALARSPTGGDWPVEMLMTISFAETEAGTRVTLRWEPLDPTEAEAATFDTGRDLMSQGWAGTFEKLDAYLAELDRPVV